MFRKHVRLSNRESAKIQKDQVPSASFSRGLETKKKGGETRKREGKRKGGRMMKDGEELASSTFSPPSSEGNRWS